MADFHQFLIIFMMGCINIGPINIWGWVGNAQGWDEWWQRLKQRSKVAQMAELRVAMTSTCTHIGPI